MGVRGTRWNPCRKVVWGTLASKGGRFTPSTRETGTESPTILFSTGSRPSPGPPGPLRGSSSLRSRSGPPVRQNTDPTRPAHTSVWHVRAKAPVIPAYLRRPVRPAFRTVPTRDTDVSVTLGRSRIPGQGRSPCRVTGKRGPYPDTVSTPTRRQLRLEVTLYGRWSRPEIGRIGA